MADHRSRLATAIIVVLLATSLSSGRATATQASTVARQEAPELPSGPVGMAEYAYFRALERVSEGSLEEAVDLLSLAVEIRPEVALYHEALGDVYLAVNTGDSALLAKTEYRIALELEPGRKRTREGLAQAALLTGRIGEAIDVLEGLAFEGRELDSQYLPDLIVLYIAADEAARGIAALEPHVRSRGTPAPLLLHLATLHRYEGELDDALALLARVKADPDATAEARALAGQIEAQWLLEKRETEAAGGRSDRPR